MFRRLLRPALHGAWPKTIILSVIGTVTFSSSRTPFSPLASDSPAFHKRLFRFMLLMARRAGGL
jgi:hypothetical protein